MAQARLTSYYHNNSQGLTLFGAWGLFFAAFGYGCVEVNGCLRV